MTGTHVVIDGYLTWIPDGSGTTNITHSAGTITPIVVNGFGASRTARSLVHEILGRPDPDITFRPAGMRSGTLKLVFATGAAAAEAEAVLVVPQVFTLFDVTVPQVGMSFVVAGGDVTSTLDEETMVVWIVEVPFQEVAP